MGRKLGCVVNYYVHSALCFIVIAQLMVMGLKVNAKTICKVQMQDCDCQPHTVLRTHDKNTFMSLKLYNHMHIPHDC